jgi:PAS domain S-box-containing protein
MTLNLVTQKQTADSYLQTPEMLASLFESVPAAVVVSNEQGSIVRVNAEVETLFGYDRDELYGRPIETLFPQRFRQIHLGYGHHYHQPPRRRAADAGLELCGRHKEGREFLIDVIRSPLETQHGTLVLSLIRDLSEREPGEALRFHLAALVDSSGDAIIGRTLDGIITSWNKSAERIFGYSAQDAIGKPICMLHTGGREEEELEIRGRLERGETISNCDTVRCRKDGQSIEVSVSISPIFDPLGKLIGASKVARDITERRRMETELEVSRAQAVSSARLSALGMMAGSIAHEINNPIGVIHASASDLMDMVETGSVPMPALQLITARIRRTADRISKIVKSLRQISREGSADPLQRSSAAEIAEQSLELCRERFREHSVRLDVPTIDTSLHVFCREVQIAQVLVNLLQNAFDAVVECAGDKWIRLEVSSREDSVVFAVVDSGPGVPLDLRARIMDPFFTTKPVGKGTGLGLSLSKSIVEEHGGALTLSEMENHTCFSFSLPQGAAKCN